MTDLGRSDSPAATADYDRQIAIDAIRRRLINNEFAFIAEIQQEYGLSPAEIKELLSNDEFFDEATRLQVRYAMQSLQFFVLPSMIQDATTLSKPRDRRIAAANAMRMVKFLQTTYNEHRNKDKKEKPPSDDLQDIRDEVLKLIRAAGATVHA